MDAAENASKDSERERVGSLRSRSITFVSITPVDGTEGDDAPQVFPPGSALDGQFRILKVVYAHGFDSVVYQAHAVSGEPVEELCAVKCVYKERMYGENQVRRARDEPDLLRQLAHRRIIEVIAAMETDKAFITVMPYATCGTLHERSQFKTVTEFESRNFMSQALEAMQFIHKQGFLHGDIKPQNYLLTKSAEEKYIVQLCDFGFMEKLPESQKVPYTGMRGTSGYFSPEMTKGLAYGTAVDLFALGCILFQLLAGYEAFDPPSHFEPLDFEPRYWKHMSAACIEFMEGALEFEPEARLTAETARAHGWFTAEISEDQPVEKFVPPPDLTLRFHHAESCPEAFPLRSRSPAEVAGAVPPGGYPPAHPSSTAKCANPNEAAVTPQSP